MHKSQPELNLPIDDWREKVFSRPSRKIRLATVFSGIGAIEHAFNRLNIKNEIVFACDNDPFVRKSYLENYPLSNDAWFDDISDIDPKLYKNKIDLFVGGSPCQSFSSIGKRAGLEDTRGTLFYDFARIIKGAQPNIFIFENVKGLLNHDKGKTWEVIQKVFESLDYKIHSQILNSKHYGIPQNRNRLFVVGFKNQKTKFEFPSRIPLESVMQDFLEDFSDSKYFLKDKGVKFVTSQKNQDKKYTQVNGKIALCQKANQQFNWHGDFIFEKNKDNLEFNEHLFKVQQVENKYYLSDKVTEYVLKQGTKNFKTNNTQTDLDIARPLLQSMHKMHRAGVDNYVTHTGKIRKLTPRECHRLMGFRDNFKISVSDTQAYRQAGNSIVVDVLIALLKQIDITKYGVKGTE